MYELSPPRITRLTLGIGAAGTAVAALVWDVRVAAAFLVGALLSFITVRSWVRFAGMLGAENPAGARLGLVSGVFLALRYVLFAGVVYVMMKYLGSAPAAILVGLLVSFAAVVLDLLSGSLGLKSTGLNKPRPK